MAGCLPQHLISKHIGECADCSATDGCRILEGLTAFNWKELNHPTNLVSFCFFGSDLSWWLSSLSETFGNCNCRKSTQASVVEKSST